MPVIHVLMEKGIYLIIDRDDLIFCQHKGFRHLACSMADMTHREIVCHIEEVGGLDVSLDCNALLKARTRK